MPTKKDNTYQHAEIIIDLMIEKSGLSQTQFAEKYLKIKGPNISEARHTHKIPDRWFKIVQDELGLSKEDLCTSALESATSYAENGEENSGKRGLSLERHREIGMELFLIYNQLTALTVEFGGAYPQTGSLAKPAEHLFKATDYIIKIRGEAEENLLKDFIEVASREDLLHYYYPARDFSREDLHIHLAKTAKEITELISRADKKGRTRKKRSGKDLQINPQDNLVVNDK